MTALAVLALFLAAVVASRFCVRRHRATPCHVPAGSTARKRQPAVPVCFAYGSPIHGADSPDLLPRIVHIVIECPEDELPQLVAALQGLLAGSGGGPNECFDRRCNGIS